MVVAAAEEITRTIGYLAARWRDRDRDTTILRHVFPLFAEGRPVSPTRLARVVGKDVAEVEHALERASTHRNQQGHVVELFGIMLEPTLHRVQVGKVALFSCCALDAHMVPLLIGQTATVESVDPVCHRVVRVTISASGVQTVEPDGAVGTLVVAEEAEMQRDVRAAFCNHVCHFPNREIAAEFARADSRRRIVDMDDLHQAARQLWAMVWR